jgi:hypothetical protein
MRERGWFYTSILSERRVLYNHISAPFLQSIKDFVLPPTLHRANHRISIELSPRNFINSHSKQLRIKRMEQRNNHHTVEMQYQHVSGAIYSSNVTPTRHPTSPARDHPSTPRYPSPPTLTYSATQDLNTLVYPGTFQGKHLENPLIHLESAYANANGYSTGQENYTTPIYPPTAGQFIPRQSQVNLPGTRMASYPGMTSNGLYNHPPAPTSSSETFEIGVSSEYVPSSSYGVSLANRYQSSKSGRYYQQPPVHVSSPIGQYHDTSFLSPAGQGFNPAFNFTSSEYNYSTAYGQAA